jgi:hypothetical protein
MSVSNFLYLAHFPSLEFSIECLCSTEPFVDKGNQLLSAEVRAGRTSCIMLFDSISALGNSSRNSSALEMYSLLILSWTELEQF